MITIFLFLCYYSKASIPVHSNLILKMMEILIVGVIPLKTTLNNSSYQKIVLLAKQSILYAKM